MFQQLALLTLHLKRFRRTLSTVACGVHNCTTACLVDFLELRTKATRIHSPQLQCLDVYRLFCLYKCNPPYWTTYATCRRTFPWYLPTILRKKSSYCNHRLQIVISENTLSSLNMRHHPPQTVMLALVVARAGNSSSAISKFDHFTYLNTFRFHSFAFHFTSNITSKTCTIHMFILHTRRCLPSATGRRRAMSWR